MNKYWPHCKTKYASKKRERSTKPVDGSEPLTFYRRGVNNVISGSKNILTSKTAWVFVLLLIVGVLKAVGLVDFELEDNEAEGIALGIVAVVGIVLRLVSTKRVTILPR